MMLCLDVGNTHIVYAIFTQQRLTIQGRYATHSGASADQIGLFLQQTLKAQGVDLSQLQGVGISSVVPELNDVLTQAIEQYFSCPSYFLTAKTVPEITICTQQSSVVGADLLAGMLGAQARYPNQACCIVDLGTITTVSVLDAHSQYLGSNFFPGLKTAMNAMHQHTAQLPTVPLIATKKPLGQSTVESMQIGLYTMQKATIQSLINGIKTQVLHDQSICVIGTGGLSPLFAQTQLFTKIHPHLVLEGVAHWMQYDRKYLCV